jgi:integrase
LEFLMQGKITKRAAEALREGEWLWDSAVTGFGAKRSKGGVFYYLRYRIGGAQRFTAIGKHGSSHTPETARREAQRLLGQIASGTDPAAKRSVAPETFGATMERYLAKRRADMRPRSFEETERHLRHHSRPFHKRNLGEIDRRAIAQRLGEIEAASGPVARNRVRQTLSAMYAWTIREGLLDINPVTGTGAAIEHSRDRVLTPAELSTLWHGLGDGPFADIVRLLILTGQRRNEIGALQWAEVVADTQPIGVRVVADNAVVAAEGGLASDAIGGTGAMIVLGADRAKNSQKHTVPLSPAAAAILGRQPRRGPYVFGKTGEAGFSGWSQSKRVLDARLKLAPWTLHDLRRTVATGMAELGVLPHIIETVLNHQSGHKGGVAGIYNRATYAAEVRAALELWAEHVVTGTPRLRVVARR